MYKSLLLVPAYGRDYLNEDQVRKAWEDGNDFIVHGPASCYINNEDAKTAGFTEVRIRFRKRTKLATIKLA